MIDSSGREKPYGTTKPTSANISEIICLGYMPNKDYCPEENVLLSVVANASRTDLNNAVNPTSGNKLSLGRSGKMVNGKYVAPLPRSPDRGAKDWFKGIRETWSEKYSLQQPKFVDSNYNYQ